MGRMANLFGLGLGLDFKNFGLRLGLATLTVINDWWHCACSSSAVKFYGVHGR